MGSQENLRREVALPWMSFGSDAGSIAPEGVFLKSQPHPRAYGTFARVLGRFVRDERATTLEDAIRRMTSFPAANLKLADRGSLAPGSFADIAVFDPATIADRATYERPHRYATGMRHVLVNGTPVLVDGEHTDARPGRVVRGRGARRGR
ncbi:MAG TPA: amidohydrolase family protein [Candidatus Limnocylindria bacterium]|nr:amidohydrolase family protein [Candidatus Limnocylindria bacterium]